jgi:hypothetical protein
MQTIGQAVTDNISACPLWSECAGCCGEASPTGTGGAQGLAQEPVMQHHLAMRSLGAFAVFGVFTGLLSAQAPPPTRVGPVTDILHGMAIVYPYRWLEDQNSSETRAWIETQNRYTQAYFARIPDRDKLHQTIDALRLVRHSQCAGRALLLFASAEG